MVPLSYYLVLSALLFAIGVTGILIRRNIITILMSLELIFNAVNINFVAFAHHLQSMTGQVFVVFVLVIAAAEVTVGLAIVVAATRRRTSINVDEFGIMKL